MKWLRNMITDIVRTEIHSALTSRKYIELVKTSLQKDTEELRDNENESYLRDSRGKDV